MLETVISSHFSHKKLKVEEEISTLDENHKSFITIFKNPFKGRQFGCVDTIGKEAFIFIFQTHR